MKIKDVRITLLRLPYIEQPALAKGYTRDRDILVVEIETQSGHVGLGYQLYLREGFRTTKACLDPPRRGYHRALSTAATHHASQAQVSIGRSNGCWCYGQFCGQLTNRGQAVATAQFARGDTSLDGGANCPCRCSCHDP